jgi:4-amino-4-deoxy-L-arabinose transferase-like glycosyltransferase
MTVSDLAPAVADKTLPSRRPSRGLALITGLLLAALGFAHAALYAYLTPLWQAPDEPAQFEYILLIADRGRPTEDLDLRIQERIVEDVIARDFFRFGGGARPPEEAPRTFEAIWPGQARYVGRQPAYHILAAVIVKGMGDAPVADQVRAVRLFSALLFGLTVAAVFLTGLLLLPSRFRLAVAAGAVAALWTMPAYIGGTVNNDNLAMLVGSLMFLAIAYAERRGYRSEVVIAIVVLAILAFYVKRTTLALIPLAALVLLAAVWRAGRRARIAGAAVLVFGGASLVAAIATFPPLREAAIAVANRYLANVSVADNLAAIEGISPRWQTVLTSFLEVAAPFHQSFLGLYGWLAAPLAPVWYGIGSAVVLVVLVGLWRFGLASFPDLDGPARAGIRWLAVGLTFSLGLLFTYALYFSQDGTAPQGRYLYVALAPMVILGGLGVSALVPRGLRPAAAFAAVASVAAFDLIAIASALIPTFYG